MCIDFDSATMSEYTRVLREATLYGFGSDPVTCIMLWVITVWCRGVEVSAKFGYQIFVDILCGCLCQYFRIVLAVVLVF